MVKKLENNIFTFAVPLTGNPLKAVNCYLIRGNGRFLLVDTGFNRDECEQAVLKAMEELNATPENTDIFVTHLHVDHCGLAQRLKRPQNKVYASKWDAAWINRYNTESHANWILWAERVSGAPPEEMLYPEQHATHANRPQVPVEFSLLQEGDALQVGDYYFEIKEFPGHTPGQIGLWEAEKGFLFPGDHILDKISPNISTWYLEEDFIEMFLQSLKKVAAMPVKRCFPAHRNEPENTSRRAEELIEHHKQRLEVMQGAMRSLGAPATAHQVAYSIPWHKGRMAKDLTPQQKWFARSETMAHLQHLLHLGQADCQEDENGVRFYSLKAI